jgi:hypothetical protein
MPIPFGRFKPAFGPAKMLHRAEIVDPESIVRDAFLALDR